MDTYELLNKFMIDTGYTKEHIRRIIGLSRQNMYNIKSSETNYHRFLRDFIHVIIYVPHVLKYIVETYPERFDQKSLNITQRYLKENDIHIKKHAIDFVNADEKRQLELEQIKEKAKQIKKEAREAKKAEKLALLALTKKLRPKKIKEPLPPELPPKKLIPRKVTGQVFRILETNRTTTKPRK